MRPNVRANPCLPCLLACLFALAACGDKPEVKTQAAPPSKSGDKPGSSSDDPKYGLSEEQAKQVLAKVGETTITLGDFAERLGGQSPYLRARYNSPERRREFLENMVRFELLALEAKQRGYDKASEVLRVGDQMMVQQMMQDLFEKQGVKLADVTDEEINAYYTEHAAEFSTPAQMRASHMLFRDAVSAQRVLKELLAKPEDMQLFRRLAEQHNEDSSTKNVAGDLRYFSATKDAGESETPLRPDAVRKAAFSLKNIGDVYPELVKSDAGFHIVKLTGKREAMTRTQEDARRLIQNRLWRQKREGAIEKFVTDLRSKAKIQESAELLAKVQVKAASPAGEQPGHEAHEPHEPHVAHEAQEEKAEW
jgi:peptidyl-prolyl cis-trans isomerase C